MKLSNSQNRGFGTRDVYRKSWNAVREILGRSIPVSKIVIALCVGWTICQMLCRTKAAEQGQTASSLHSDDMRRFDKWHDSFGLPPKDAMNRMREWVNSHPGDFDAVLRLGQALDSPEFGRTDPEAAYRLFERAGASGRPAAQTALGHALVAGVGVRADPRRGIELLTDAAKAGEARAIAVLGECYQHGVPPVSVDTAKARELLTEAARRGYGGAWVRLAAIEAETTQNSEKMIEYLRSGTNAGDPQALYNLARLYHEGEVVQEDVAQSFQLMKKAADWGSGDAMAEIADYYWNGWGTPHDAAKAHESCKASAELGCPAGEGLYADVLLSGRYDDAPDVERGMKWMFRAARDGDSGSQYFIGIAYLTGAAVERDEIKGRQWLEKAMSGGNRAASSFKALLNARKYDFDRQEDESSRRPISEP